MCPKEFSASVVDETLAQIQQDSCSKGFGKGENKNENKE